MSSTKFNARGFALIGWIVVVAVIVVVVALTAN